MFNNLIDTVNKLYDAIVVRSSESEIQKNIKSYDNSKAYVNMTNAINSTSDSSKRIQLEYRMANGYYKYDDIK